MFKSPFQQLRAHWQQYFERYATVEDFANIGEGVFQFFRQDLSKLDQTKIDEGAWKIISGTKIRACTAKNVASK